ncbi:DUF5110 domain-containing protein [candidate division KSB1 bacterium]|nr:DUF5110 domain-containing protein [candidate division KSB1 bacterium]
MQSFEKAIPDWGHIRITALKNDLFRIQIIPHGEFKDTGLNRYGFILEPADSYTPEIHEADGMITIETTRLTLSFSENSKELLLTEKVSRETLLHLIQIAFESNAASAHFAARREEDWVGFGDQTRKRLYHRGHIADLWVRNVSSYIPVPFFMSTLGVGILVNTTHHVAFDMCRSDESKYSWRDKRGAIDFYAFVGNDFKELLKKYTDLTGKPKLPPDWSFGLWYLCRMQANDYEVVNDALNFRREEIPCDVIGLEPGWMQTFYDYSVEKKWNDQLFPIPFYAPNGPHNFTNALKRMGFHLELWLCNDYDLSFEAERQVTKSQSTAIEEGTKGQFHAEAEVDEHFSTPCFMDKLTKRDQGWFEHLKKFIDQGAEFFKQDGSLQVNDHPDRIYGNGMRDAEMHNLYPLLYSQQMYRGFETYTRRRPLVFTVSGWAGFQAWCGTWTGDTGGRLDTLGGMLNTAMVGHSWITNDMEVAQKEGIHFGYLQPWSQINSWNYFRMPWLQGGALLRMHQYYSRLRARLFPYLYSWAYESTLTGMPLMRPLTLEFQNDPQCKDILHQYLLGRDLLVVIYKPETWLPEGKWKDYWSGQVFDGKQKISLTLTEDRGGGLFVRSGAIIPFGQLMQYRGERALDEIMLYVFPAADESHFEFYEDDGVTLDHRNGKFALTPVSTWRDESKAVIKIEKTVGSFEGQPGTRKWRFTVALEFKPSAVKANGVGLSSSDWQYDNQRHELKINASDSPVEIEIKS